MVLKNRPEIETLVRTHSKQQMLHFQTWSFHIRIQDTFLSLLEKIWLLQAKVDFFQHSKNALRISLTHSSPFLAFFKAFFLLFATMHCSQTDQVLSQLFFSCVALKMRVLFCYKTFWGLEKVHESSPVLEYFKIEKWNNIALRQNSGLANNWLPKIKRKHSQ